MTSDTKKTLHTISHVRQAKCREEDVLLKALQPIVDDYQCEGAEAMGGGELGEAGVVAMSW